jgi:hypothetical protein
MSNEGDTMPGTAVEQVEAQDLAARNAVNRTLATANVLAASSLLRADLRGKVDDVRAIAITLHQLGVPPTIPNMNLAYVVKGRVEFEVRLWTALAARAGHEVWVDADHEGATAYLRRSDSGRTYSVTFTWDDAVRAGLNLTRTKEGKIVDSETYKKFPTDMLAWRALGRVVKRYAPEVVAGMVETDNSPVAHPRARPLPADQDGYVPAGGRHYPETDDDITDAELVEQGEDIVIPGHATVAPPGPGTEADPEELAAFIRWKRAGKPRDENGFIVDVPATEAPERGRDNAAAEVVEPQTAPAASGPVPGEWRARAVELGVSDNRLLIMARDVAGALGVAQPQSLKDVTDEVAAGVLEQLG